MTTQYIVGELSGLLAGLEPGSHGPLRDALEGLRHEIEADSRGRLSSLAAEALDLADSVCWTALEQGDLDGFQRYARVTVALHDFACSASLLV